MSEQKIKLRDIHMVALDRPLLSIDPFPEMFRLKKVFIELLKPIEDLTNYPLDLNKRGDQEIIKDFVGRITEELFEAQEAKEQIMIFVTDPNMGNINDQEIVLDLIFNYNEELADVTHFMIELLILCGIEPEHISKYYIKWAEELQLSYDTLGNNDLECLMYINKSRNFLDYMYAGSRVGNSFGRKLSAAKIDIPYYIKGSLNLTQDTYNSSLKMIFGCIYNLNKVRMNLKIKKWRDNHEEVSKEVIHTHLMVAFDFLMRYFELVGYDYNSMLTCYLKKDAINITRLKNKI